MADVLGPRVYTRAELELIAVLAAEQATVGALPPVQGTLTVTTEAHAAAKIALAGFEARVDRLRPGLIAPPQPMAGYTVEQLSGRVGRVREREELTAEEMAAEGDRMGYRRSDELDG